MGQDGHTAAPHSSEWAQMTSGPGRHEQLVARGGGGGYEVGPASSQGTAWRTEAREPGEGQAQGKLASSVNSATRCRPGRAAVGTGRQEWESLSWSHFLACLVLVPMRTLAQME